MFKFKVIGERGRPDVEQIRTAMLTPLRKCGQILLKDYQSTIATWEGGPNCVKFKLEGPHHTRAGDITVEVTPESGDQVPDRTAGVTYLDVWNWLNKGTSVRHAMLAPDFRAKTHPGRVRSGPGQRASWKRVSRRFNFPGQEPRNWDEEILTQRQDELLDILNTAIRRGMEKYMASWQAGG